MVLAIVLVVATVLAAGNEATATPGNTAFERTWNRTDLPVIEQRVNRTWMWGPAPFTGPMMESMTDRPVNGREVQYFDKSRMERTIDPTISQYSIWYVTNGLLARELVTGQLQTGNSTFEERSPATVNVAGDWDDPSGPTYATFQGLLSAPAFVQGMTITTRVDRDGNVSDDPLLTAQGAIAEYAVPETGHTVASPFWSFMNSTGLVQESGPPRNGALFPNPFYATGLPITEAYWANVKVGGVYTDVLIQVFERRVLTYTPGNPQGWQVEAGNVGRHYFEWRYGISPPAQVRDPGSGFTPLGPTPLPRLTGQDDGLVTIEVANMGREDMNFGMLGPEDQPGGGDQILGCIDCPPPSSPPASCDPSAPAMTFTVPAGTYAITTTRQVGDSLLIQAGIWTFLPDRHYGVCFFTFR